MVTRIARVICSALLAIVGVALVAAVLPLGIACCLVFGVAVAVGLASIVLFLPTFGGFVLAAYAIAPRQFIAILRGRKENDQPEGDPVLPEPEMAAASPESVVGLN